MTQDEIISLAREAGLGEPVNHDQWDADLPRLERFAALVAAHEREKHGSPSWETVDDAIAAERKACAKVCDKYAEESSNPMNFAENCAAAIRARGEK